MPALTFPPFPVNIQTHPLLVIDYQLIKAKDKNEMDRLWEAGTKLGFWYLKNHGADEEANGMFEMGAETMALPLEENMKFEQGDDGRSFGYKATGANAVDASGLKDLVEFINVSKDDALAWPKIARREYPSTVNARMESTIAPFVRKSMDVTFALLDVFNDKLGLPEGTLRKLHPLEEFSGSETRVTKSPPAHREDPNRQMLGSHTDFGTLSFLHNRLGGLQVLVPGAESWQYIKPLPGHAICNVGDALAIFSGGILRSNLHRVVPPPGEQSKLERWSLVFFIRPGNSVILNARTESKMIADSVKKNAHRDFNTGSTAEAWFARRVKYQRINNRKGPESWQASRGTEDIET
ncbi:hypothetical protein AMATHDRAFT_71100 [Amanita thiersii Skay4041]|uniref:Fe2OG dioxygenase domain-containing protein n=1 Tax=Amanita thiersii Skay4041 TaxID=703135 RepID=A0A2A9NDJ1_9AGAR|nr:hypothetical protein AMATHDRAFT_71100 [Amanita thiersii Skay4041]